MGRRSSFADGDVYDAVAREMAPGGMFAIKAVSDRCGVSVGSLYHRYGSREGLLAALGAELAGRVVSGENLAIGWLETRTEAEMEVYPTIGRIAHRIIAEGLSDRVIQPGVTTTADVQ